MFLVKLSYVSSCWLRREIEDNDVAVCSVLCNISKLHITHSTAQKISCLLIIYYVELINGKCVMCELRERVFLFWIQCVDVFN